MKTTRGRFGSVNEPVRAKPTLIDKEQQQELGRLRSAIDEGGASGEAEPFDIEAFLVGKRS